MDKQIVDKTALKRAFGTFPTGVTVFAVRDDSGEPRGFTANSLTSVSLEPPLLLICIGNQTRSFDIYKAADRFAVTVLAADQQDVSVLFAGPDDDRFSKIDWVSSPNDQPIINGGVAWFDCRVDQRVMAGDHVIMIGQIENFSARPGQSLGYYRSGYQAIDVR